MPYSPVTPPTTRERIGGRAAGSLTVVAILCGLTTVMELLPRIRMNSVTLVESESMHGPSIALQCAAIAVVYGLARCTVLRHRIERPVAIWVAVLIAAVAGTLRLVVAVIVAGGISPALTTAEAAVTIASSIGSSTLIGLAVTYLVATRSWYIDTRRRLIRLDVEMEARRLRAIGALDALESVVVATAQSSLDGAADAARAALARAEAAPETAATALLDAARTGVRPAAQALARTSTDRAGHPRISVSWAIAGEFHRHPLPILVPCLILVLVVPPRFLAGMDIVSAFAMTALLLAGVVVTFRIGRPLIRRAPRSALLVTSAACVVAVLPLWVAMERVSGVAEPVRAAILTGGFLLAVTAIVSFIQTVEDSGEAVLEALRQPLAQADLDRLVAEHARETLEREIGRHLHSGVQPQLVAASYAIQDAVERGDRQALEEAIASARTALDRRLQPTARTAPVDVRATVDAQWAGLLAVQWEPEVVPSQAQIDEVAEVIRECLANALVHGHADAATVAVAVDGAHVDIRVADNGRGPQNGEPGLGSAVLNEATGGQWRIESGAAGGSVVTARVPVVAASSAP